MEITNTDLSIFTSLLTLFEGNEGYDADNISEYKKVTGEFTITYYGETETIDFEMNLVKYNGEWRVFGFYSDLFTYWGWNY